MWEGGLLCPRSFVSHTGLAMFLFSYKLVYMGSHFRLYIQQAGQKACFAPTRLLAVCHSLRKGNGARREIVHVGKQETFWCRARVNTEKMTEK